MRKQIQTAESKSAVYIHASALPASKSELLAAAAAVNKDKYAKKKKLQTPMRKEIASAVANKVK